MEFFTLFSIFVIIGLIGASVSRPIAAKKNRDVASWTVAGFAFGILAIIVLALLPPLISPPAGMRAVRCSRCNAEQNIPANATEYTCWQCGLETDEPPLQMRAAKHIQTRQNGPTRTAGERMRQAHSSAPWLVWQSDCCSAHSR